MKIIAVIPARYQSKRFPGKVLALFRGKTLIEHIYRQAEKCPVLSGIIVATDDDRVLEAVRKFRGSVRKFDGRFNCGSDRIAFLARDTEADVFINLQADEPFMPPEVITATALPFENPGVLMTTAATPFKKESDWADTNAVKVVVDRNGDALYFSRAPIPYDRDRQGRMPLNSAYKHLGIYGYRRDFLLQFAGWPAGALEEIEQLEQLRAMEYGAKIRVVITPFDSQSIDTSEDLSKLEAR